MSKIYAIVGPTGIGKTKLSIMISKKINAEIINFDSMQIYKEMNIGTAKPNKEEQSNIIHHLLGYVSVNDEYSVYKFQTDARKILDEKIKNNINVVLVGGTGLYLKALLYDYKFNQEETNKLLYDVKIIGLTKNRKDLYDIINNRVDIMINNGLLKEAKDLYDENIKTRAVSSAIGYKELFEYFDNKISKEEAIDKIKQNSRKYAKRQYTFFNNQFDNIIWYDVDDTSIDKIVEEL